LINPFSKLGLVYLSFRDSFKLGQAQAGLYSISWSIGFSIGPAIAGWLQSNINLSASFVFGGLCLLVAPSLLLIFFGRGVEGVKQGK
jgi:MFS family permease